MNIACYIDVSNIYYRLKEKSGRKLNYYKYYKYLEGIGDIKECICYSSSISTDDSVNNKFQLTLEKIGYKFKSKDYNINRLKKNNFNVEMTIDILSSFNNDIDMIVIGSADTSLIPLINYLVSKDKKVMILASGISKKFKGVIPIEIPESLLL